MPPVYYDFTKSPDELVEYLKSKKLELTFNYDEMLHEAHQKAFTVAKITKLDLLSDIHLSIQEALAEGKPFSQWRDEIQPTLEKKGWWGEVEAIDPRTGEVKDIFVGSRRLRTIYDTNMRTAYAKGRYEAQMDSDGEYFGYFATLDGATRPKHAKLHGTILPKTDKFWDTNYAPNDYFCRCKIRVYTKAELDARGLKPSSFRPPNVASKSFAYNPGKVDKSQELYKQKVDALKCKSTNAKGKEVDCGFLNAVKEDVIVDKNEFEKWFKYENKPSFTIASLHPKYKKILAVKSSEVPITKKVLQKQKEHHPEIKPIEYLAINSMINKSDLVIKKGDEILVHIKNILGVEYFCVVYANAKREKAFVASFRKTDVKDIEREKRTGEIIYER